MSKRINRLLSLLMAVVMIVTLAVPAMATEVKTNSFQKVDNSTLSAKMTALHEAEKITQDAPYGPNDSVRVSIFLEKNSTIEAGFAPMGIAENEAAINYRKSLKAEQEVLALVSDYLPIAVLLLYGSAARAIMNALLNGSGNYMVNFATAIFDGIVMRIGLAVLFGLVLDMRHFGFWLGDALAGFTPFVIGVVFYFSGVWKKGKVETKT